MAFTVTTQATPAPISFLREKEVLKRYPVSRAHWWKGIKSGEHPQPVKLSKGITGWRADEIDAFLERIAAMRAAA